MILTLWEKLKLMKYTALDVNKFYSLIKPLSYILILFFSFQMKAQKQDFTHVDFTKADSIAKSYTDASLRNMPVLVYNLIHALDTDVEKFRAIHTWVCLNIESDHYFSETTIKKRRHLINDNAALEKWNTKVQSKVYKKLLKEKKTICSGYAYILKTLTNLADMECEIVDGYARTVRTNVDTVDFPNHSWNVVKLNDTWYFADTTQASGYYNLTEEEFVKNYNEGYFLATPELFAKNHYPLNTKWLLLDKDISLKSFVGAPIIYQNTYKHGIIPLHPNALVTQIETGERMVFRFKVLNEIALKEVRLLLDAGFRSKTLVPVTSNYKNGILEFAYQFDKKGQYDVHLKIGKDVVSSCTIEVEKPKSISAAQNF